MEKKILKVDSQSRIPLRGFLKKGEIVSIWLDKHGRIIVERCKAVPVPIEIEDKEMITKK